MHIKGRSDFHDFSFVLENLWNLNLGSNFCMSLKTANVINLKVFRESQA